MSMVYRTNIKSVLPIDIDSTTDSDLPRLHTVYKQLAWATISFMVHKHFWSDPTQECSELMWINTHLVSQGTVASSCGHSLLETRLGMETLPHNQIESWAAAAPLPRGCNACKSCLHFHLLQHTLYCRHRGEAQPCRAVAHMDMLLREDFVSRPSKRSIIIQN